MSTIRPVHNMVLVKFDTVGDSTTASGIYVPETTNNNVAITKGKIVSIGKGLFNRKVDDVIESSYVCDHNNIKVGDTVMFKRFSAAEVEIDNDKYALLSIDDIMAVLED